MDRAFDGGLEREAHGATSLAGGVARMGAQCGMVWGAALAAGAEAHRRLGAGARGEAAAMRVAGQLVDRFRAQNGAVDCYELTATDFTRRRDLWRYLVSGKPIACFRMAARYAPVAFAEARAALAAPASELEEGPVSCAAVLARRVGATEQHAVMAAGLGAGIGLSGGGCGALGAAVWLDGTRRGGDFEAQAAAAGRIIDRFRQASEDRFECAEIVGRRFGDVAEHAAFVRGGGCAGLLEALAAAVADG